MEMTLAQVAGGTGVSIRSLQRGIISGALPPHRRIGPRWTVDGKAGRAFMRSRGHGRLWSETRKIEARAAWDAGSFAWHSTAEQLAHVWGSVGGWRRLSGDDLAGLPKACVDMVEDVLGLWGTSWFSYVRVRSFDELKGRDLRADPWGNVGVLVRPERYATLDAIVDAFLLGDTRESEAARRLLEARRD